MNVPKVVDELKKKYPGKNIVFNKNADGKVTEIVCEVIQDPDFSWAIAVIDRSPKHYHNKLTETYKIFKGELIVNLDGKEFHVPEGGFITIKPGTVHYNIGNETWVDVISHPGWTIEDYIPVD